MKLPARQMHELNDAQLNFEALQKNGVVDSGALAAGVAAANVGTLGGVLSGTLPNPSLATGIVLQLLSTGTTRKLALGTVSLTWTAAQRSAGVAVAHGLGVTPIFVAVFDTVLGGPDIAFADTFTFNSTNFSTQAGFLSGTFTGSKTFAWAAIG